MAILTNTRTCEMCKTAVPVSGVKLFPKDRGGTWTLCEACCEKMKQKNQPRSSGMMNAQPKTQMAAPRPAQPQAPAHQPATREAYICTRCSYKFRDDKSKLGGKYNLVCPYCGKPDKVSRC